MRRFFDLVQPEVKVHYGYARWPYISAELDKTVSMVQEFYHSQVRAVHADHLLVRLLTTLGVPLTLDHQTYYDRVSDIAYRHAAELHLPSPTSRGGVQYKNTFYGAGVTDVIAVVNYPRDRIAPFVKEWKWIEAVKVYRHPLVDLSISIPNGKQPQRVLGDVCVAVIDLPLLALQYKCWFEDNLVSSAGNPLTIENFIAMYVLPNMLPRQTQITLANRIFATYRLGKLPEPERINPMSIPRYEHQFDGIAHQYLDNIATRNQSFDQLLLSIPQLFGQNYPHLIQIPEGPITEPIGWVWLLAQLPTIEFLVRINKDKNLQRNEIYLRNLRLAILDYTSAKVLSRYIPEPLLTETLRDLELRVVPYIK